MLVERRHIAVKRFHFHLGVKHSNALVYFHLGFLGRSLLQVEVHTNCARLVKECVDLLLEQGPVFHLGQIKAGQQLLLAVPLKAFLDLSKKRGSDAVIER